VTALTLFIILALPLMKQENFAPFAPLGTPGVIGAAASIFFAYVGFDAVSTAAEETKNPQRNVPLALIGSLVICTIFYLLVASGAIGAYGAQPLFGADGAHLAPGSRALAEQCASITAGAKEPLVCSKEALAHVLREIGYPSVGNLLGLAAFLALPSVILMMIYGQTRLFFVMSRDGLLPAVLSKVHPKFKTPHVVTMVTGVGVMVAAAFFPVGSLADISNSGTLFAFLAVSITVVLLRIREPNRHRPFKAPLVWIVAPLSGIGCIVLFMFLPPAAKLVFPVWSGIGLLLYFAYGFRNSHVGKGIIEVPEADPDAPPTEAQAIGAPKD
jgi:basic amino acid/polyamine antiporter, APA family